MASLPAIPKDQCMCGAVGYAVTDAFEYAMYRCCSRCRRTTGSAFKAIATLPRGRRIQAGPDGFLIYGDKVCHNVPCRRCGSLPCSVVRDGIYVNVAMGTLIGGPTIRPSMHICGARKAARHDFTDDMPWHEGLQEL